MSNKAYTKGTPKQFRDQLVNKIQELGGAVESSQQINASADITLNDIKFKLNRAIGSRMEALRAVIVNLGDGNTGIVYEDSNSGDATLLVITMNSVLDVRKYETMAEVYADILQTWGVDASIDSATNLSITDDKLVSNSWFDLIDLIEERGYEVDSIHKDKPEELITLYKGNKEYYAEVTHYTDGGYELQMYNIHYVGEKQIASASDIDKLGGTIDKDEYVQELGEHTVEVLENEYNKNADFEVVQNVLRISIYNTDNVCLYTYYQDIDEIEAIEDDLDEDAHTLAADVVNNLDKGSKGVLVPNKYRKED